MSYTEIFDSNEWETLQFSMMWVFRGVAGADGKIDKEEQVALTQIIKNYYKIPYPLIKEVLKSLSTNPGVYFRNSINDSREYRKGLEETAEILDSKVSLEEALIFKKILTTIGIYVANASGDKKSKISNEEVDQISRLAYHLKLKMEDLQQKPTVDELLKYFV